MTNNELVAGIATLIIIGLVILVIVEASTPTQIVTRREKIYIPYPSRKRREGHRNTPFCLHTAKGCYPGTQTPIP